MRCQVQDLELGVGEEDGSLHPADVTESRMERENRCPAMRKL
jgi:hypothetical protein